MITTMSSMAAMHEDMHQRAGQQQQERQRAEEVGTVLRQQEVRGNSTEHEQTESVS